MAHCWLTISTTRPFVLWHLYAWHSLLTLSMLKISTSGDWKRNDEMKGTSRQIVSSVNYWQLVVDTSVTASIVWQFDSRYPQRHLTFALLSPNFNFDAQVERIGWLTGFQKAKSCRDCSSWLCCWTTPPATKGVNIWGWKTSNGRFCRPTPLQSLILSFKSHYIGKLMEKS